jgi:pyrimidine deaminase RibD-like protein
MATIGEFFNNNNRKTYVAAQQDRKSGALYYFESNSLTPLPPSVYVWAYTKGNKKNVYKEIMTNYPKTWVNTYGAWEYPFATYGLEQYVGNTAIASLCKTPWNQFSLDGLGTKPNLTSLYDDRTSYSESRARRVYMLASFCILKKHGRVNYSRSNGHNIGSILVSNEGEVLSWGVNTGGFCHAEINTLIGYFAKNPDKSKLPAKSVIFTTLKPCQMCSTLIKNAENLGSKLKAWYGMVDEGKQGGTALLGKNANEFDGEDIVDLDVFELMSEDGTLDTARKVEGTKRVNVPGKGTTKIDLSNALNKSGGGHKKRNMSAADWVDNSTEVWRLVESAVTKLQGKVDKPDRDEGPMKAALAYLKGWALK